MAYSSFFGIELGKRALMTYQLAQHTTAHNISNANTPGYSRQTSSLVTGVPFNLPEANRLEMPGQLGTGVKLDVITRARDMLLEHQIQTDISGQGHLDSKVSYLDQVQSVIQEPSDNSVGQVLDRFWAAWQELSAYPEDMSVRSTVIARGTQLVQTLQTADKNLQGLQQQADTEYRAQVAQINDLGAKIRDLNVEINKAVGVDTQPNDLMDLRDNYMRELSKLANVQGQIQQNGLYSITISGHTLVQDNVFVPINVTSDPANNNFGQAVWSDDNTPVGITDGKMQGLADVRDTYLPLYRNALDQLAQGIMSAVNPAHAAGYALNAAAPSGENFFTGTGIQDWAVNPILTADPTQLAAATNPAAPGDGSNALAIAQLQTNKSMNAGTQTIGEYYQSLIAQIGQDGKDLHMRQDNQNAIVDALNTQQDGIAGVNIDEEMTNMIKYQDGYQAAARMISTMDSMLDTIINRMGSGR